MKQQQINRILAPHILFLFVLVGAFVAIGITHTTGHDDDVHWLIASTALLFYALANPLLSLTTTLPISRYILQSFIQYVLLIVIFLFAGKFNLMDSISEHKSYLKIILVISLYYIVALGLSQVVRGIYKFTKENM